MFILCIIWCEFFVTVASVGADVVSVSVMEGDSVTLYTGLNKSQQERMKWYFLVDRIAEITGDQCKICTDAQCKERFRDRLKLDHQTGSLTITNIRITDSGLYKLQINSHYSEIIFGVSVSVISAALLDKMRKNEGESVSLDPGVINHPNDMMMWYFNDSLIAEITGDQSEICTDDQCKERFRDRLKFVSGSLTITNCITTDSGLYKLQINSSRFSIIRSFSVTVTDAFGVDTDGVSVMEGDSVALHTDIKMNQQDRIRWYFNTIRIAEIIYNHSKICTDDQCKERFMDRLKLDSHTADLTITNIRTTDAGVYVLLMNSRNSERIFYVAVSGVSAAERDEKKIKSVKEGESVTLDPDVIKPNDLMRWYFNNFPITVITGDQSKICTDDQCKERFRDRLKLDHQTGSLIIMDIRTTDSGLYKLQINSSRFCIIRSFSVTVTGSGPPSGDVVEKYPAVIGGAAFLLVMAAAAAFVIYIPVKIKSPSGKNSKMKNRNL
uniref:Immunoglobulin domain-containing protein n=1 Tax=Cyprinus carpio TaxID=7962 RepID=A0A8C2HC83_CYPCA